MELREGMFALSVPIVFFMIDKFQDLLTCIVTSIFS